MRVAVLLVSALAASYLCLDPLMSWLTQRRLDELDRVVGTFRKVRVTLWPPGYDVYDLKLVEKPARKGAAPVAWADRVELKWSWRALLRGRLQRRVTVRGGRFLVAARPADRQRVRESMRAVRLERLALVDTQAADGDRDPARRHREVVVTADRLGQPRDGPRRNGKPRLWPAVLALICDALGESGRAG